jgi:hypothetical protein
LRNPAIQLLIVRTKAGSVSVVHPLERAIPLLKGLCVTIGVRSPLLTRRGLRRSIGRTVGGRRLISNNARSIRRIGRCFIGSVILVQLGNRLRLTTDLLGNGHNTLLIGVRG